MVGDYFDRKRTRKPGDQLRLADQRAGVSSAISASLRRSSPGRTSSRYSFTDAEPAAGFDDRHDGRDLRSGFGAADVQPVLAPERDWPHRVLRQVVGQLDFAVVETAAQFRPHVQRVGDGFAEGAFRQHRFGELRHSCRISSAQISACSRRARQALVRRSFAFLERAGPPGTTRPCARPSYSRGIFAGSL